MPPFLKETGLSGGNSWSRPGTEEINIESAIFFCVCKKIKSQSGPYENVTKASLNELLPVNPETNLSIKIIIHSNAL